MKKITLFTLWLAFFSATLFGQKTSGKGTWMLQSAVKLDDYSPALEPDDKSQFFCPLQKKNLRWEEKAVSGPTAVAKDGWVWMLYRADDEAGISRIGLAKSRDGLTFRKNPIPVLYPDNDDKVQTFERRSGCKDPRLVKGSDSLYVALYTTHDGQTTRICVASSRDLMVWKKHGFAFNDKKDSERPSKSGAVVCEKVGEEILAKKIKGKYWMYWGGPDIFLATSDDLISWKPVTDKKGNPVAALKPRPGFFDSKSVEPGPFALFQEEGILLPYNSTNDAATGDKSLPAEASAAGQALFSNSKPEKLVARADRYLMHADREYEQSGQTDSAIFLSGMVWHKDRWLLYYGAANSKVALAECKQ